MAQLTTAELEQIQSYLAQQGVTFNATSTDASKREVIYAAINQITRNPAQVFGYKLDDYNFSRSSADIVVKKLNGLLNLRQVKRLVVKKPF